MLRKLGQFFLLVSIILISLFYASDVAGQTNFNIFAAWLGTSALAFLLLRRSRKEQEQARRFRTLRKLGGRGTSSDSSDEDE